MVASISMVMIPNIISLGFFIGALIGVEIEPGNGGNRIPGIQDVILLQPDWVNKFIFGLRKAAPLISNKNY